MKNPHHKKYGSACTLLKCTDPQLSRDSIWLTELRDILIYRCKITWQMLQHTCVGRDNPRHGSSVIQLGASSVNSLACPILTAYIAALNTAYIMSYTTRHYTYSLHCCSKYCLYHVIHYKTLHLQPTLLPLILLYICSPQYNIQCSPQYFLYAIHYTYK